MAVSCNSFAEQLKQLPESLRASRESESYQWLSRNLRATSGFPWPLLFQPFQQSHKHPSLCVITLIDWNTESNFCFVVLILTDTGVPDATDPGSTELDFWSSSVWLHRPSSLPKTSLVRQQFPAPQIIHPGMTYFMEADNGVLRAGREMRGGMRRMSPPVQPPEGKSTLCSCWTQERNVKRTWYQVAIYSVQYKTKKFLQNDTTMEPVSSLSNPSPTQTLPHHHVGPAASGVKERAPSQTLVKVCLWHCRLKKKSTM